MIFTHPKTLICSSLIAIVFTGCSSVPVEKGPSMESIWGKGLDSDKTSIELLREGLTVDPMLAGAEAGYPMVSAPTVLPIWERGSKVGDYIKTDGRWIYEIVTPGGFIN
jgi:hypothetical protein